MSTEFYIYNPADTPDHAKRLIGVRQLRANKTKAFVWSMAPHEFHDAVGQYKSAVLDGDGYVHHFDDFMTDVRRCSVHELEPDLDE